METTLNARFERVHQGWECIICDAVKAWNQPASLPYLGPLLDGRSFVVWDNSGDRGWDNQAVSHLLSAVLALGNCYERMGFDVSAADCRWLAELLTNGDLTIISAVHLGA